MKSNKLFGLVVLAFACGVVFPASAVEYTEWFSGDAATAVNATKEVSLGEVGGGKIVLTNGASSVKLTPDSVIPANLDKTNVVVTTTACLTPFATNDLFSLDMEGSQVSFAVAYDDQNATNFYGYVGNWKKLVGADLPADGADTTFTVAINYFTRKVTFAVGETTLTAEGGNSEFDLAAGYTHVADVSCSGKGSLTSVDADYQKAIASYGGIDYITILDAVAKKETTGGTDEQITVPGLGSQVAANGLPAWQSEALGLPLNDKDAVIRPVPVAVDKDADWVTLAANTAVEEGLEVKYEVFKKGADTTEGSYPAGAIKIPLETGVYTVKPVITTVKQND